jgi:hypothetical protein
MIHVTVLLHACLRSWDVAPWAPGMARSKHQLLICCGYWSLMCLYAIAKQGSSLPGKINICSRSRYIHKSFSRDHLLIRIHRFITCSGIRVSCSTAGWCWDGKPNDHDSTVTMAVDSNGQPAGAFEKIARPSSPKKEQSPVPKEGNTEKGNTKK